MYGTVMFGAWWVWPVALSVYVLFRAWYDNWRQPLSREEVERYLRQAEATPGFEHTERAVLQEFLCRDDGKAFVMCNLVRLHPGTVPHPRTGELTRSSRLLQAYFREFVVALLQRGGHPVLTSRKVAGYIDSWNTPPDPGWTLVGMIRYRSRRDMLELILDPRFTRAYPFKAAAVEQTHYRRRRSPVWCSVRARQLPRPRLLVAALCHRLGTDDDTGVSALANAGCAGQCPVMQTAFARGRRGHAGQRRITRYFQSGSARAQTRTRRAT
ncbi:MAG: hypothetical protein R3E50_10055 [Halioglobus sp.]